MLHKQRCRENKIRNILFRITNFSATYGTDTAYERGCTAVTNPADYVCQDIGKDNQVRVQQTWDSFLLLFLLQGLHYCNCHGDACNQNWSTAGSNTLLASLAVLAIALLI